MQRIPGVTLSRGDGGEGRNISVRGLGPTFTRVRINGMEAAAQTGSSDIYGAGNNGRSFDFNVFPTEIFSELTVLKTPSADVEEGSLGATVDLKAPRPFDYRRGPGLLDDGARRLQLGQRRRRPARFDAVLEEILRRHVRRARLGRLPEAQYPRSRLFGGGHALGQHQRPGQWRHPAAVLHADRLERAGNQPDRPTGQGAKGATVDNCSTNNPRTGTIDGLSNRL